jgi:RNA methyltransferase, TrmH family
MISKNKLKYYSLLQQKKQREVKRQFIAEGLKIIEEGLKSSYECEVILMTEEYEASIRKQANIFKAPVEIVNIGDFSKLTDTVTPQGIAAVFNYPPMKEPFDVRSNFIVCLENIGDPGNLGTIFRNCAWFGTGDVVLSKNCADAFSPKTVRSSMGSIFHIDLHTEIELAEFIQVYKEKGFKILCADTTGENMETFVPKGKNILILSSESHGPSDEVLKLSDHKITIPRRGHGESLNVGSASAVLLACLSKKL